MDKKKLQSRMLSTSIGFTALLALTGVAQPSAAQITEERTHAHSYDVKNYAIDKIATMDLCVLAGTIFDPGGTEDHSINLMITQNFPAMIGNTIVNKQYDDPGFDERAIGVHYINDDPNNIVVVASRRDLTGPIPETNIEILRTDGSGSLQPSFLVRDPNGNNDMHPMGTLAVGNDLYICGYMTAAGIAVPDYRTTKQVFVVKVDLGSNTVAGCNTWDYNYSGLEYDYDMAVRMKLLSNGNIYVTGSCSGYYTGTTPPPYWDPMSAGYYCATLSLFIDANLNTVSDKPFSEFRPIYGGWPSPDVVAGGEYGNDIVEDLSTGGYFVFGNTYVAYYSDPNPTLQFFTITYINGQTLVPGTLRNRYRGPDFDYAWGIEVEQGNSQGWFVLSGVQTSRNGFSNPPYPTTMDNINPFLAELRPTYFGGSMGLATNYWNTILSNEGTGTISLYPNNYYELGGFNSHIAWSPRNTTRGFDWTNDIFLSAPIWNPNGLNKLNMKTIRTNPIGQVECPDEEASPGGVVYDAPQSISGAESGFFAEENQLASVVEFDFNADIFECSSSGIFKPTGINTRQAGLSALTIIPNPAHEFIGITLEGDFGNDARFSILLTDMTGRHVADLYHGNQAGLKQINLPSLAKGLYLVKVQSTSGKFKSQLLTIQ